VNPREYALMARAEERHWWYVGLHELLLRYVLEEAGRLGRRPAILDAGCGTGRLAELMGAVGDVEAWDASPVAVELARARGLLRARLADLNEEAPAPQAYDVITTVDVLYHRGVRDDVAVLRSLRTALRPGGLLLVNVPAWEALRGPHDEAVHTRERYRPGQLRERLRCAGLVPQVVTCRLALLFPLLGPYRLARRLAPFRRGAEAVSDVAVPAALPNRLLLGLVRLENRLVGKVPLPLGTSVFAVARRPAA